MKNSSKTPSASPVAGLENFSFAEKPPVAPAGLENFSFEERHPDDPVPDPNYKIRYDDQGRILSAPAHATQESFEAHCLQRKPTGQCECDAWAYHECVCDIRVELMTDDSYVPGREDLPSYY